MAVENICGPWIYSARESNMPIVEELRRDVPGPVLGGLFLWLQNEYCVTYYTRGALSQNGNG